jgi:hypothetical protein
MTPAQDLFVGIVAALFGGLLVMGAILNAAVLMRLGKSRRLAEAVGESAARFILGGVGLAVIAMGVLIASGWRAVW